MENGLFQMNREMKRNYLSFDVFMGRSAKSRNVDLTPDVAYLYKDLSEYYKNKYPQAGVKTVVVLMPFLLNNIKSSASINYPNYHCNYYKNLLI